MLGKENLQEGVFWGVLISVIIGIAVSLIFKPTFNSIVFIVSLAMLPGFFIMSLVYFYKLGNEKISKTTKAKKFDWGVEINLKKLQIVHNKYSSMVQTAGLFAAVSFFAMVFIAKDFPLWATGHLIFFPIATILFVLFSHLAFRWWFNMREDYKILQFHNLE